MRQQEKYKGQGRYIVKAEHQAVLSKIQSALQSTTPYFQKKSNTEPVIATMEAALNVIRDHYTKADASERHKIQDQIRSLQDGLYTDWEVLFGYAVGVSCTMISVLKPETNIFRASPLGSRPDWYRPQDFHHTCIDFQYRNLSRVRREDWCCSCSHETSPLFHGFFGFHQRDHERYFPGEPGDQSHC
jgi:hypothetical protein